MLAALFANSGASEAVVNTFQATGTLDWLGIVNMRIHRPKIRRVLTVLKDWEPPLTWATASVRP